MSKEEVMTPELTTEEINRRIELELEAWDESDKLPVWKSKEDKVQWIQGYIAAAIHYQERIKELEAGYEPLVEALITSGENMITGNIKTAYEIIAQAIMSWQQFQKENNHEYRERSLHKRKSL